jgi:hypothetical protein
MNFKLSLTAFRTPMLASAEILKHWKALGRQKLSEKERELQTKIDGLTDKLKKVLVRDKALIMATELAGDSADVLLPHIERRLQANLGWRRAYNSRA